MRPIASDDASNALFAAPICTAAEIARFTNRERITIAGKLRQNGSWIKSGPTSAIISGLGIRPQPRAAGPLTPETGLKIYSKSDFPPGPPPRALP